MSVRRSLLVLLTLTLVLPVGASLLRSAQAVEAQAQEALRRQQMQLHRVGRGDVRLTVSALGAVEAEQVVDVSFLTGGVVRDVLVETGDYVYAGQPLARLDDRTLRVDYDQARLALERATLDLDDLLSPVDEDDIRVAEANVASAQGNYSSVANRVSDDEVRAAELSYQQAQQNYIALQEARRVSGNLSAEEIMLLDAQIGEASFQTEIARLNVESLRNNNQGDLWEAGARITLAQRELEQVLAGATQTEINDADVALQQAEANLRDAETALNRATLLAPVDGTVTTLDIDVGQTVATGTTVLEITDNTPLKLIAQVDEVDVGYVTPAAIAYARLDALPELDIPVTVERIDLLGTESEGVVSYNTRFVLNTTDLRVRVGMTGEVFIVTESRANVLTIPTTFLSADAAGGWQVTTMSADGEIRLTPVEIGLQSEDMTEIVSGLNEGDTVVLEEATS